MAEAGPAGAGVVHGQADAAGAQGLDDRRRLAVVGDAGVLGDLDDEALAGHVGRLEQFLQGSVADGGRAQVEGQVAVVGKPREVGQRRLDDGQVERGGQAQLLADAETVLGRGPVVEAAQGLDARHPAGVELDDGLVHQVEAVVLDDALDGLAVDDRPALHWLAAFPGRCHCKPGVAKRVSSDHLGGGHAFGPASASADRPIS